MIAFWNPLSTFREFGPKDQLPRLISKVGAIEWLDNEWPDVSCS
jgi:hypothetical protein